MNFLEKQKFDREQDRIHKELLEIFADDFTMEDLAESLRERCMVCDDKEYWTDPEGHLHFCQLCAKDSP